MNTDELFEYGLEQLHNGNRLQALASFEKAYSVKKLPQLESYIGYCIACERGQIRKGEALCKEAISQEPGNAVNYLNLSRVYLLESRNTEALDMLRAGLSYGDNEEIKALLNELSPRKKPFFPFLSRDNFLNKYMGKLIAFLNRDNQNPDPSVLPRR